MRKKHTETLEEKVERFDKTTIHYLFTITVSIITAILTTLAVTGKI